MINKLGKFDQIFGVINEYIRTRTRLDTRLKFCKATVVTTLLHGNKSCLLNKHQYDRIQAEGIRCVRMVKGY